MRISRSRPTIEDVAKIAGVSDTAVSWVLSGNRKANRVSEATKKRIIAAAEELGYSRNLFAAALKRGYSDTIVLLAVTWDVTTSHSDNTLMAINRVAANNGLSTIVHIADNDSEAASFLQTVSAMNPYGLLLLWESANQPTGNLLKLKSEGLPIIDLMPSSAEGIVNVTTDRQQGFYLGTRHLIDLGHRQIAVILDTTSRSRTSNQKLAGYRLAIESADVEFQSDLLQEVTGVDFEDGYNGVNELLRRRPDTSAVMCINDRIAFGAVVAIQEKGLSVPRDLSVAGYGAQKLGTYSRPRLTTIGVQSFRVAECAVGALIKMRKDEHYTPQAMSVPMELIVRESTGPVRIARETKG
ncbi:MAG: LacI family DNA-binding transcriptional regulator [Armatimonadetes bacterium]|nr:LacI family DNA-binding transcriptional regulator [Armatimonadota bacterium]